MKLLIRIGVGLPLMERSKPHVSPKPSRRTLSCVIFSAAALLSPLSATAAISTVDLGTDSSFAILAGSGITVAGAVNSTSITGDIGSYPTTSITGLENVVLNGVNHGGDAVTENAKHDLVTAYNDAAGRIPTTSYGAVFDLGGKILPSGVYFEPTSFGITGTLTLDAAGNPDAVWIFQAGSTLTTASSSQVLLTGGAQACQVFWQVGSSATLGAESDFVGNILAFSDITLTTGATVDGRLLARNGAVTLDSNTIVKSDCNVPDSGGALFMLGSGLAALFAYRRTIPFRHRLVSSFEKRYP